MINNLSNRSFAWLAGTLILSIVVIAMVMQHMKEINNALGYAQWGLYALMILAILYGLYRLWHVEHLRSMDRKARRHEIAKREHEALEQQYRSQILQEEAESKRTSRQIMAETHMYVRDARVNGDDLRMEYGPDGTIKMLHISHPQVQVNNNVLITQLREEMQRILESNSATQALSGPEQQVLSLPNIEMFYDLIPYNSLQVGMGIEATTGKPVLAPIVKSTHFKLIGGSGQGKSCVAAAILDIATTTNDPDHLRIGLLDLEHNTSRLFENLDHVAEIGPKKQRLVGRDPDEVAQKLKLLQAELTRRAQLGEEYCREREPVLLVYVEEMLALKYEVVDEKLKKEMLAAITILAIRGRKYGIFFLACMQTDYSDKNTREAMAQYRTRAGFAIDPDTARASGFFKLDLIKENFQVGRRGQYVLEKPQYSSLVLSPDYDVALKLEALSKKSTTRAAMAPTISSGFSRFSDMPDLPVRSGYVVESTAPTTGDLQPLSAPLTDQEKRILRKWREGMGMSAIIQSEYTNSNGEPLKGGDLFKQKAAEIQALIGRFLPVDD
jgi:hypothetical protein